VPTRRTCADGDRTIVDTRAHLAGQFDLDVVVVDDVVQAGRHVGHTQHADAGHADQEREHGAEGQRQARADLEVAQ
jgi:hypothetical protein